MRERLLDRAYEALAGSDLATRAALRLRGAATAVLGKRLAPSTLPERNGELWLAGQLGADVEVAVDVGANVGDFSAMALESFPRLRRLVAYEPGAVAAALQARLDGDARATVVRAAVSDRSGELRFAEDPIDSKLSSAATPGLTGGRRVPCVCLDDELPRLGLDHVEFLKIDVEGLDLHVLRGAGRSLAEHRVDAVQFEYGPLWQQAGSTLHAAYALLTGAGYRVLLITPHGVREFPYDTVFELFMYANFVALSPAWSERLGSSVKPVW